MSSRNAFIREAVRNLWRLDWLRDVVDVVNVPGDVRYWKIAHSPKSVHGSDGLQMEYEVETIRLECYTDGERWVWMGYGRESKTLVLGGEIENAWL